MGTSIDSRLLNYTEGFVFLAAVTRGTDYLLRDAVLAGSSEKNWALATAIAAAPLCVWGGLLVAVGLLGILGEVLQVRRNRGLLVYVAHAFGAAMYLTLGVGIIISVAAAQQYWGWSGAVETIGYGLAHVGFMQRLHAMNEAI